MRKFLRGQSGFSMVQGLVLAGIIAGSSLVATRLIVDQKITQKAAETRDQVEDLHSVVYSLLQNRLNCKATMMAAANSIGTQLNATAPAGSTLPLTEIHTPGSPSTMVLRVGNIYMNNNVRIQSMRLLPQAGGFRVLEVVYDRMQTGASSISLKKGVGAKDIKKFISLRIQRNPTGATGAGEFTGCYAVTADKTSMNGIDSADTGNDISKELCESMNTTTGQKAFVWIESSSICAPRQKCTGNKIYTGINSLGEVKCRDIQDWMDFNEVIDPQPPTCPIGAYVGLEIDNATRMVRIRCIGTSTSCGNQTISWNQGLATCTASVPSMTNGQSYPVTDTTAPTTGSASAVCNSGTWTVTGNCTSVCPASTVSWTVSGVTCSGPVSSAVAGSNVLVNDTTAPNTGNAGAVCNVNTGVWTTAPLSCTP